MKVVIPVKPLGQAKVRLSAILCPEERKRLALCMLEDVLGALLLATEVAEVYIVYSTAAEDREVKDLADRFGVQLIDDRAGNLNGAVKLAGAQLVAEGAEGMLVFPADVPQVTAAAIDELIRQHRTARQGKLAVNLVPAEADGGTNALILSPPDVLTPVFGENSCEHFIQQARRKGLETGVFSSEEIALDIDRPDDLLRLQALLKRADRKIKRMQPIKTQCYLEQIGVFERLSETRRLSRELSKQLTGEVG